ncbi:hypothetical protein [Tannockella kyphosi]|uniref:hypothetical protein n=1 Tax=Tannockella kyphosi TaxID=2899121 RepID=UPI002013BB99|nr:hypothetical protein [Tannockella kyphosi]
MNARIIVSEPQKSIECGICNAKDEWLVRIETHGVHGLFCKKCNTITVFEEIRSKLVRQSLMNEARKQ